MDKEVFGQGGKDGQDKIKGRELVGREEARVVT